MSFVDVLLDQLQPYMTADHEAYLRAIASMWDEVDSYVGFDDEETGWSNLLDPDLCPAPSLPYLAQYMGERLPFGLAEPMQREWISDHPNMQRGTLESIARAAQRSLINNRMVSIVERSGGAANPEDYLQVRTYTADTPNPAQVLKDLLTTVPADIALDYQAVAGQSWNDVKTGNADWNAVEARYANWFEVRSDLVGRSNWERPRPIGG